MTTVLVPLDGSELAQRAVPFALGIARRDGRSVLLLRAVNTLAAPTYREGQILVNEAADALEAYAATLADRGLTITTRVVDAPAEVAILEAAEDDEVDLIVMSTHGRSGLGRWIYGSVADAVLRDAPVPVLIIPPHGSPELKEDGPVKILVPLDGSALALSALGPATRLADSLDATLVLGSVVTFPHYAAYAEGYTFVDPAPTENALAVSREYLQEVAATIRTDTRKVEVSAMFGSPFFGVAMLAAELQASLIVMATHGRGGLARAVMGSVASATLKQSEIPVLMVRPDELARIEQSDAGLTATEARPAETAMPMPDMLTEPAEAGETEPTVTVALTPEELNTLILALGERFHSEPVDPRYAETTRELLAKLRAARAPSFADPVGAR
ncbi:MAG: universal stress protein [Chloroflexi bacterium]|nr:universal stress protein [Chloroflexota bacterium]